MVKELVMDLITAIDSSSKDYDIFLRDLLTANDDLPSNLDDVNHLQNAIISYVNSRLNQSSTRQDGLDILLHVLPQCSKEAFSKYAVLWIAKSSTILEDSQSNSKEVALACQILGTLIVRCKDIPDLHKMVSMQTVKQLINTIANLRTVKSGATLYLIASILCYYKESSEKLQNSVRKIILPLVDVEEKNLVQAGANCYTLLSRVTERLYKPPTAKSVYSGWLRDQAMLCNSLHAIMDDLFAGLIELESNNTMEKLDLPIIPEDNVIEYYRLLERRFTNLCVYLSTMLRGCAGKNSVIPNVVLQVLCRGLAVTPSSLRIDNSFKQKMLHFVLPKLHISLFTVLNAMIEGFKKEIMPYAVTILQLYQQTLKWTEKAGESKTTIGGGKPLRNVRTAVYKSIVTWLSSLGTLSGIDIVADDLLPHLLKDITPERERVLLTVQKTQNLSKRALKRYKDSQYENSASLGNAVVVHKDPCANAELCINALKALENIFINVNCALKQSFYKCVQNVVVSLLYDYYLGKYENNFYEADNTCRWYLLRSLRAIQLNPHPSCPPPTQYSIEIYGMALRDADPRIVHEAKLVVSELEKIAHPSAPTLQFPIRDAEEPARNELAIHWSRPTGEPESSHENGVAPEDSNVWESFREARKEIATEREQTSSSSKVDETQAAYDFGDRVLETSIGPTPSKQQKFDNDNLRGELMDTSEDEFLVSQNDNAPQSGQVMIAKSVTSTQPCGNQGLSNGGSGETYHNLKRIREDSSTVIDVPKDTLTNQSVKKMNGGAESGEDIFNGTKAKESDRQIAECLDDNSADEAMLNLFCDELKES